MITEFRSRRRRGRAPGLAIAAGVMVAFWAALAAFMGWL